MMLMATASADPVRMMTPPEVGRRLGIKAERVIAFIRSGELRGINLASAGCRRPRFRIDPADLAVFLDRRVAGPTPKTPRRRKHDEGDINYF